MTVMQAGQDTMQSSFLHTSRERAMSNLANIRADMRDISCVSIRDEPVRGMVKLIEEIEAMVLIYDEPCMGFSYRSANISEDLRNLRVNHAYEGIMRLYAAQVRSTGKKFYQAPGSGRAA